MARRSKAGRSLTLLVRGMRFRRGIAVTLVATSTVSVLAAAAAPSYQAAASISALRNTLTAASPAASGVAYSGTSTAATSPDTAIRRLAARLPNTRGSVVALSNGKITSKSGTEAVVDEPPGVAVDRGSILDQRYEPQYAMLSWRQNECQHLRFVSGRCPTGADEVALARSPASVMGAVVGSRLTMSELDAFSTPPYDSLLGAAQTGPGVDPSTFTLTKRVVGVFTVLDPEGPYWFGQDIGRSPLGSGGAQHTTVTVLASREALVSLPLPLRLSVSLDEPLDWSSTDIGPSRAIGQQIQRLHPRAGITVISGVPGLLRTAAADRGQLDRLVGFAELQLLALVGLVTVVVAASSLTRRRGELVSAGLRGERASRTALRVALEPSLLLGLGLVPGLLATPVLVTVAARVWLRDGTPVGLPGSAVLAGAAVVAAVVVVTVVLGFVAASRPLADQLVEDDRTTAGRSAWWIDVLVGVLVAVAVVELVVSRHDHRGTPWTLLAPSLSGLAGGLVAGRVLMAALQPAVRATANSPHVETALAVRFLRRDRAAWRITAVVAMGVALLGFATVLDQGAAADRLDRAGLVVGGQETLAVSLRPGVGLQQAVHTADPTGRWAMAAVLLSPYGDPDLRTLAVDTPRLEAVAGWSRSLAGLSVSALPSVLHVSPARAQVALPVLTAGAAKGTVMLLDGTPSSDVRVLPATVLPELLGSGTLVDLDTIRDVSATATPTSLGLTAVSDQVWLGAHAPADALTRLEQSGLRVTGITRRAAVAGRLNGAAQPVGLDGYLAVGGFAAALVLALLVGTAVTETAGIRADELAMVMAGVPRRSVRRARLLAATFRLVVAGVVGLGAAIGMAHLTASLVPLALPDTVPAPHLPLPLLPAVVAAAVTAAVGLVALTGVILTSRRGQAATARTGLV